MLLGAIPQRIGARIVWTLPVFISVHCGDQKKKDEPPSWPDRGAPRFFSANSTFCTRILRRDSHREICHETAPRNDHCSPGLVCPRRRLSLLLGLGGHYGSIISASLGPQFEAPRHDAVSRRARGMQYLLADVLLGARLRCGWPNPNISYAQRPGEIVTYLGTSVAFSDILCGSELPTVSLNCALSIVILVNNDCVAAIDEGM